jgi:hypothetical protein
LRKACTTGFVSVMTYVEVRMALAILPEFMQAARPQDGAQYGSGRYPCIESRASLQGYEAQSPGHRVHDPVPLLDRCRRAARGRP